MDCVFCRIAAHREPADVVYEDHDVVAFLDKYPQTCGHLQLVPKTHRRWIYDLPDIGTFFTVAQKIIRGIIPVLGADHVTIATFGSEVAHAHLWIVPQYKRETKVKEGLKKISKDETEKLAELMKKGLR